MMNRDNPNQAGTLEQYLLKLQEENRSKRVSFAGKAEDATNLPQASPAMPNLSGGSDTQKSRSGASVISVGELHARVVALERKFDELLKLVGNASSQQKG